jgi:hypothetical protein
MTVFITLTTAGPDSGPFNLYSDIDGFVTPFEVGVSKIDLENGYSAGSVPDFTSVVRVLSTAQYCINYVDITLGFPPTTTTSTSSTTTTSSSTTTTSTTLAPLDFEISFNCGGSGGINATISIDTYTGGSGSYESGVGFFTSEVAALANTSWAASASFAIGIGTTPGTYWMVIRDTLGTLKAKSIAVAC